MEATLFKVTTDLHVSASHWLLTYILILLSLPTSFDMFALIGTCHPLCSWNVRLLAGPMAGSFSSFLPQVKRHPQLQMTSTLHHITLMIASEFIYLILLEIT